MADWSWARGSDANKSVELTVSPEGVEDDLLKDGWEPEVVSGSGELF